MKAEDFDPMKMTKAAEGEDLIVEDKLVKQINDEEDERFGSPWGEDTKLKLAFRAGMSWARARERGGW